MFSSDVIMEGREVTFLKSPTVSLKLLEPILYSVIRMHLCNSLIDILINNLLRHIVHSCLFSPLVVWSLKKGINLTNMWISVKKNSPLQKIPNNMYFSSWREKESGCQELGQHRCVVSVWQGEVVWDSFWLFYAIELTMYFKRLDKEKEQKELRF